LDVSELAQEVSKLAQEVSKLEQSRSWGWNIRRVGQNRIYTPYTT